VVSQRVAGVPPVVATGEPEGWEIIFCIYTMISLNSQAFFNFKSIWSNPNGDKRK
jgi:hypothetical protein